MKKIVIVLMLFCVVQMYGQSSNFRAGKKAYDTEMYEKAMSYFDKDIEDNPKSPLSYRYRADIYYRQSQYAYALSNIYSCLTRTPRK